MDLLNILCGNVIRTLLKTAKNVSKFYGCMEMDIKI